jgi:F-type H+-transporting ATPase subunit epsilon
MAAAFRVSVVTPEREVLAADARFVALPAYDGEMGILARRAPLLVQLGSGKLRVEPVAGASRELFVSGGFAQMVDDRLTVLTEEASELDALRPEAAVAGLSTARGLPSAGDEAWTRKQRALDRARALGRLTRRAD